ncbi:MAG: hypothetical protein IJ093_02955, partial [Bacilli bacterium]|nr:hypothetical protein [Bacilli bacterium]
DGEDTGYRKNINGTYNNSMCNDSCISDGTCSLANANTNVYQYCVYMFSTCKDKNDKKNCNIHYKVTTYMYFDVPVISELVRIPVSSETMTFRKINS